MPKWLKSQPPLRIIALGFASAILIGSILLILPCSVNEGVKISYIDSLYTSTSAVCITGLVTIDVGNTFTSIGQFFLALLMQVGGLGLTAVGTGIILAMRKKVNIKGRVLVQEAMNMDSREGIVKFVKSIFITTAVFELAGAAISFVVFVRDYPPLKALGISLFHSVAAFNNSGFDLFGGYQNLIAYQNDVLLNMVTSVLVIFGGIGFLVIRELWMKKFRWKKLSMHSKAVITVSALLLGIGTLLIKATEDVSWMGAFFNSVSARSGGFSTYPLSSFTSSGLMILIVLMFIGASPGSTGGGIKTSTLFVLVCGIKAMSTNETGKAFHYSLPDNAFRKAAAITLLGLGVVVIGAYVMSIFEPELRLVDIIFEVTSAFGTVGLSTGITPALRVSSKILSIVLMYIGRLGPLTIASIWHFSKGERIKYPEGNIAIG